MNRQLRVLSGLLGGLAGLLGAEAYADFVQLHTSIPATGTPAKRGEPPCSNRMTTADQIIALLDQAGRATGYGEITGAIRGAPWLTNRLQVMLGVHNGPAYCRIACAIVPRRPISYRACVDGRGGPWCVSIAGDQILDTDFRPTGSWARGQQVVFQPRGSDYVNCFLFKNWKHDWDRNFTVTIYY